MHKEFEANYHSTEENHFWFRARRQFIIQLLKNYPRDNRILDIGCSSGILLSDLIKNGFNPSEMYGIDISQQAIDNCKKNGIVNAFVMDAQNINLSKSFDIIIASDSLEHLKNDEKALQSWYNLLKPDGILYVFVPAYRFLWSHHDDINKHYRRYTRSNLRDKLNNSDFKIVKSGYWNFVLFLPIMIMRLLGKLIPSKKSNTTGDLQKLSRLNRIFFQILCLENKILKHLNFPFGLSAFCIARKKTSSASLPNKTN